MPYAIRHRSDGWCVVKETDGKSMGCHPSRQKALDQLRALYAAEPGLASLDWAENRIIADAALRWQRRYGLGGSASALCAAARLADPSPLTAADVAWLDDVSRAQPVHAHLSRDLAGRAWPRTAAVSHARMLRLSKRLAQIDLRLGDRLYAGAVAAMRDALRRAGVKAQVRAKNRGKTATLGHLTPAVLAAISTTPDELLDRAFVSLRADAHQWILDANKKRAQAVADTFDGDPADLEDDPTADHRAEEAAALLALLLLRRARSALTDVTINPEALQTVPVPFSAIRTAMRVRDGWQTLHTITPGPNRTPEADTAAVTMIPPPPGSGAIDELLGKVAPSSNFVRGYEWVHGYFGDPKTPFPPHADYCDGLTYTDDTRDEVLAADPGEWPYVAVYSTDDHPDCFPAGVIVAGPLARGVALRWFEGALIEVRFASEQFLSATPNHPILTRRGWVPIGGLREGDDVVRCVDAERVTALIPDDYQMPALIEDVVAARRVAPGMITRAVPVAPEDFHGDGAGSEVCVIAADSSLMSNVAESSFSQPFSELGLIRGDLRGALTTSSHARERLGTLVGSAPRGVRSLGHPGATLGSALRSNDQQLFADSAEGDTSLDELRMDEASRDAEALRAGLLAEPGLIEFDQVREIHRVGFAGYVHSLQTRPGWFIADGVIVSNCTCYETITYEPE